MARIIRGAALVFSIGLALHLILPQIPGIERSFGLIFGASPVLMLAALFSEAASEACYAGVLGRTAGAVAGSGPSLRARRRRGIGPWFAFRLTVTGYGAAHVLPGGGAAASAVAYGGLRGRGLDRARIALSLAVVAVLTYGALGLLFAASLLYLLVDGDLGRAAAAATVLGLAIVAGAFLCGYAAYRNPRGVRRLLRRAADGISSVVARVQPGGWPGARTTADALVTRVKDALRATGEQLSRRPSEVARLSLLALGYWIFDALCLILVFAALGVKADPVSLLVAYGVATMAGSLPLTPGGIGVFEATMLATLALLGEGSDAAVAVLGYRLFNFWLPIPLAAIFYPTLRWRPSSTAPTPDRKPPH